MSQIIEIVCKFRNGLSKDSSEFAYYKSGCINAGTLVKEIREVASIFAGNGIVVGTTLGRCGMKNMQLTADQSYTEFQMS